jgi:WD40 repeat protein
MESKDVNTTAIEPGPKDIVCVYSQEDESFYHQLKKSLNLWVRQGHVRWLELCPGDETATTWQNHVKRADLILLLLSPDFFHDDLCYQTMHLALKERASRQVPVVPILVRAVNWQQSECRDLAVVPHNEQPVASWALQDEAYVSIAADLVRLVPAWQLSLPTHPRLFQARDLPKGYVPRPKAFDAIKRLLLNRQDGQTTAITTALRGAGGFGKTTLALALCHDLEIQIAFPDGILWVELGEHPPRSLDLLNELLTSLEPSHKEATTLGEARERWRATLHQRVCLLVIDDVWQAEALAPLLEGGPHCLRLITTRNDLLLPNETERIWVDEMEPQEALAVLCRALPKEIELPGYQSRLTTLAERLGCWPLLLTLAHGMLTDLIVEYHLSIPEALSTLAEAYQTRGVTAFRLDNADERQRTVDACLRVSIQHLEKFTHSHYRATERYQELAVFPEDTDIPLATLQIYWKGSAGLESWETKDLCTRLHRLSLLLTCDLGKGTIRLHDVMRSYLIVRVGSNLPALHKRFLAVSKQTLGLSHWVDLPVSEHYPWHYLVLHLCGTKHPEELQETFTDLLYLARKVLYVGVSALETDLLRASALKFEQTEGTASIQSLCESLHRTIVQISHLLRQVSTLAEVGGLLLSYLGWEPAFAVSQVVFERSLPHPFLTAWHPLPGGSSSALRRTLRDHTGKVSGCAVSTDGSYIVSASYDQTLKVWDAATGAVRFTLMGHTGTVRDCAVSGDGSYIVSASDDHTLKVWDAGTGAERLTLKGHIDWVSGCATSVNGRFIISASYDQTLKVWNTQMGQCILTFPVDGVLWGCAFHPDGEHVVACGTQGGYFLRLVV